MIFDEIWRMQRQLKKMDRAYFQQVKILKKDHGQSDEVIDRLVEDDRSKIYELSIQLDYAQSDAIVDEAHRLKIPIPLHADKESWSDFFGRPYLTPKGYSELRTRIRQEQKERREMWTTVVRDIVAPIGGIIISILSLMIAYAALKLKH